MKAWTNLKLISEPDRIKAMPKDDRGYPIPAFASTINGKPDFRVVDPQRWFDCLVGGRCQICRGKMLGLRAFVGGPMSMQSRTFTDAPMHQECAEYALQACPFLAAPKFAYARDIPGAVEIPGTSAERPDFFGVGLATEYQVSYHGTGLIILVYKWERPVEFWQHGKRLPHKVEL